MVAEDVVELEMGELDDQLVEPSLGGLESLFLVRKFAPSEVEGITVENEDFGVI